MTRKPDAPEAPPSLAELLREMVDCEDYPANWDDRARVALRAHAAATAPAHPERAGLLRALRLIEHHRQPSALNPVPAYTCAIERMESSIRAELENGGPLTSVAATAPDRARDGAPAANSEMVMCACGHVRVDHLGPEASAGQCAAPTCECMKFAPPARGPLLCKWQYDGKRNGARTWICVRCGHERETYPGEMPADEACPYVPPAPPMESTAPASAETIALVGSLTRSLPRADGLCGKELPCRLKDGHPGLCSLRDPAPGCADGPAEAASEAASEARAFGLCQPCAAYGHKSPCLGCLADHEKTRADERKRLTDPAAIYGIGTDGKPYTRAEYENGLREIERRATTARIAERLRELSREISTPSSFDALTRAADLIEGEAGGEGT